MFIQCVLVIALGIFALSDIRCRKIPLIVLLIATSLIMAALAWQGQLTVQRIMGTVFVCGVFTGLSVVTGEKIGLGDGMMLGLIHLSLGMQRNMEIMMLCFCIAFVIAIVLLVYRKADRDTQIPLAPILLVCTVLRIGEG